jgi:hypothetical protein
VRRYKVVKGTYATEQEYRQVERKQIEYRTGTMNYDQKLNAATYKNVCPDLERKLSTNCIMTSILILLYSIGNNYLFQESRTLKYKKKKILCQAWSFHMMVIWDLLFFWTLQIHNFTERT